MISLQIPEIRLQQQNSSQDEQQDALVRVFSFSKNLRILASLLITNPQRFFYWRWAQIKELDFLVTIL